MIRRRRFLVTNGMPGKGYKSVFERSRLNSLLEARRRALSDNFPVIDDRDFISHPVRFFHLVSREKNRYLPFFA